MEAAGCGGAGMRAVRQRNPTWALRCPAFPSLKYYSVRVERGERENRAEPLARESPRRRFHATINVLSPPPRRGHHTLVRCSPRGCFVARTYVLLFIFFPVHSPTYVSRRFRSSTCPSVRSFVRSFLGGPIEEQDKKRGQCQGDRRDTHVVTKEGETFAEICAKMANGIGCL